MPMLQGIAHWAKVTGPAKPAYGDTHNEWSIDVSVDDKTIAFLKENGVDHKIRNKDDDRGNFLTFRRKELKKDGSPAARISIVDAKGDPWDMNTMIGNGSVVNVKYVINEGDLPRPWKRPDIIAMQVVELVEYGDGEFFPVYDNDAAENESWG